MAEYYGYFNGLEYGEEFVSLVNKILVKSGVFDNGLIVSAGGGMTVQSDSGAAIIDGFIYYNDEPKEFVLSPAHGSLPRIDSIMLRWDIPNRKMNLIVVTGTAQSNPSAPTPIRDNTYYDLQIATIRVNAGAASITAASITDTRPDSEVCGITSGYNSVDIDAMMTQYTSQFGDWFEQIKGQLDEDAAGNLQNQIDEINSDLSTLESRDYIAEQGTSGIWRYRKWDGGLIEYDGVVGVANIAVTTAWGSLFRSVVPYDPGDYPYPFPLESVFSESINFMPSGGDGAWILPMYANSLTISPQLYLLRGTSGTVSGSIYITIKGYWK